MPPRFTTISDIAKVVGVSPSVVSFVLNGSSGKAKRYCSEPLRRKIEETALKLNYIHSNAAATLKGRSRNLMAVLLPQFLNEFFTQMALEIEKGLEQEGYMLSICNTFDDPVREASIIKRACEQRVDGIFIVPAPNTDPFTLNVIKSGMPLVVMDRHFASESNDYHCVLTSNYDSARLATLELKYAGLQNIALINWKREFGGLAERKRGFLDALYDFKPHQYQIYDGDFSEDQGYEFTQRACEENPDLEGIVYSNQILARKGIDYLLKTGRIPGRNFSVAMVGAPKWAKSGLSDFTCVDINGPGIGQRAAQIMLSIIKGEYQEQQYIKEYVPCLLCHGNSIVKKI